jgi:hypothetical protein
MDGGPTIQQTTYGSTRYAVTPLFLTNQSFALQQVQKLTIYT